MALSSGAKGSPSVTPLGQGKQPPVAVGDRYQRQHHRHLHQHAHHGGQGGVILAQPLVIVLIAVPLVLQSYGIFAVAYAWAYLWRVPFRIAAPCALIGTSNFFELAVAVAISLFGLNSGAALATVVGVLVEVPVMLSLVAFANRTRGRFPPG